MGENLQKAEDELDCEDEEGVAAQSLGTGVALEPAVSVWGPGGTRRVEGESEEVESLLGLGPDEDVKDRLSE